MEIRLVRGVPFNCRLVGVELRTEQRVLVSQTIGSSDTVKESKVCADPIVFAPPVGEFFTEALALNVPVLLQLPRDVPPSGYLERWNATTVNILHVTVVCGRSALTQFKVVETFPIAVQQYDSLPLYRQFNEAVVESTQLPDRQANLEVELPVSSLGPGDPLLLRATVAANPLYNRRKKNLTLKLVTLQLKHVFEAFDGGLPPKKDYKVLSQTVESNRPLTTEPWLHEFVFEFPRDNEFLLLLAHNDMRDYLECQVTQPTATFNRNRHYTHVPQGVPLTHLLEFSLRGKLYSIRFELCVKVKIGHGKDMEMTLPVTVSPYDRSSCEYLLPWIKAQCMLAREKFGRDVVGAIAQTLNGDEIQRMVGQYNPPPTVFKYTKKDWVRLGYASAAFGKLHPERLTLELD